jgi:hypothetical protein
MIWVAVVLFALCVLLFLSNVGLQTQLDAARKDAKAWQDIAEAEQSRPVMWSTPVQWSDTLARYGKWH